MARLIAGDSDVLETASLTLPNTMSWYAWEKNPGTVSSARAWDHLKGQVQLRGSANRFLFQSVWSSVEGIWIVTSSVPTWANWNHFAVTYNGSSSANVPTFYINGSAVSIDTTASSPSGTINNTASTLAIGNRRSSLFAQIGGAMAYMGFHNVVLTAAEINYAMRLGFLPRGAYIQIPMLGDSPEPDYSGAKRNATVSGATVATGPPVTPSLIPAFA
jgi:hypothetical protein